MALSGRGRVSLLVHRTATELGVDIASLNQSAHQKVYVRCQRCDEEFLREFRHLHALHSCPTQRVVDGTTLRYCDSCSAWLPLGSFDLDQAGNSAWCQRCCVEQSLRLPPDAWFTSSYSALTARCDAKHIELGFGKSHLRDLFVTQRGLCYYARMPLEFGTGGPRDARLVRLDPHDGYTIGNVVLCSRLMAKTAPRKRRSTGKLLSDLLDGVGCHARLEGKRLAADAILPTRKRTTDAGYDVAAIHDAHIEPHGVTNVQTGLIIAAPDGYYYSIEGRSSMWMAGVMPFRGIVDAGYIGPLMVAMMNTSGAPYSIKKGDRIAQLILHRIEHFDLMLVEEFGPEYSSRGTAGFGSSGR